MITAIDFLYICLGIGFLVLVAVISYVLFSLATFLITLRVFIEEINLIKNGFKIGALTTLKNLLSKRR